MGGGAPRPVNQVGVQYFVSISPTTKKFEPIFQLMRAVKTPQNTTLCEMLRRFWASLNKECRKRCLKNAASSTASKRPQYLTKCRICGVFLARKSKKNEQKKISMWLGLTKSIIASVASAQAMRMTGWWAWFLAARPT